MNATTTTTPGRTRVLAVSGILVAASLSFAGASAAMADDAPEPTADATTQPEVAVAGAGDGSYEGEAQLDAYFGAGYTFDDALALSDLWSADLFETKVRAGQALLDGESLPVAPGSTPVAEDEWAASGLTAEQATAFFDAGYSGEDIDALNALWSTSTPETKARAGQLLLDGEALPVAPSGQPAATGGR